MSHEAVKSESQSEEISTMTKKHFIALADSIREHNKVMRVVFAERMTFNTEQIDALADFCAQQNSNFNRERWLGYIAGTNGKNGGAR
jgi:hypothetical protein